MEVINEGHIIQFLMIQFEASVWVIVNLLVTQYGGHNNNSHQHKACCNGWPNDAVHANIQSRHTCQKEKADGQEPSSNSDVAPWFIVFVHFLIAKISIYNIFK